MIGMTGLIFLAFAFTIAMTVVMPLYSYAFTIYQPIDCTIGTDCFIQNYVDVDPSDKWADYTCGPLSYDKHSGTDIRLKNLAAMRAGVNVLAAADGKVVNIRDGMADSSIRDTGKEAVADRECGNGVLLEHKSGYQTQYCHMMNGSIAVKKDDVVKHGDVLGKVGLSGSTEFPHLHLSVRSKDGKVIDPFIGLIDEYKCGDTGSSLWHPSIRKQMAYQATGLLEAGFSATPPTAEGVRDTGSTIQQLPADAPALIFWGDAFGLRKDDALTLTLKGPDGATLVTHTQPIPGNKAIYFQFIGKKRHEELWPAGTYTAQYTIKRGEETVVDKAFSVKVGD